MRSAMYKKPYRKKRFGSTIFGAPAPYGSPILPVSSLRKGDLFKFVNGKRKYVLYGFDGLNAVAYEYVGNGGPYTFPKNYRVQRLKY